VTSIGLGAVWFTYREKKKHGGEYAGFLEKTPRWIELGKKAKIRVKDFSIESHCEKVYQLYKKIGE